MAYLGGTAMRTLVFSTRPTLPGPGISVKQSHKKSAQALSSTIKMVPRYTSVGYKCT
jgi:hypothetical protein